MKFVKSLVVTAGVVVIVGIMSPPASADGDAALGAKVFAPCKACHLLEANKKGVGPTLHGVFGRKAGTLEGFDYSKDMKAAGEKGLVWDDATFVAYIEDPKKYLGSRIGKPSANTKMVFPGLKKEKDRQDLLAYLKKATQ
ncbi:MAG TPA: c-type cytochrome [Alphaproteobacteria bacterium]